MGHKMIAAVVFFPAILFIGVATSYEDIKISRIRNKLVLLGIIYSFIAYFIFWVLYGLARIGIFNPYVGDVASHLVWYFDKWCINLILSTIIGYLLWHFKVWGAGDAKLFICYAALIPLSKYTRIYFDYYFVSFLLLIAIFIPSSIALFLKSGIYFMRGCNFKEGIVRTRNNITRKLIESNKIEIIKVTLGFFVFFLSFRILREELRGLLSNVLPNQNTLIIIALLIFRRLVKIFKKKYSVVVTGIIVIVIITYLVFKKQSPLESLFGYMGESFLMILAIMVLFPLAQKLIELYSERTTQKTMPFAPWMFLGALIVWFF